MVATPFRLSPKVAAVPTAAPFVGLLYDPAVAGDLQSLTTPPYDQISPYLVSSIMTTEDNGFFKHRGWVTPEFKTALRRNLAGALVTLSATKLTVEREPPRRIIRKSQKSQRKVRFTTVG